MSDKEFKDGMANHLEANPGAMGLILVLIILAIIALPGIFAAVLLSGFWLPSMLFII